MVKSKKGKTHLVIPDAHVEPGINNDRFLWLGKMILHIRPDVVICLILPIQGLSRCVLG